MVFIIDYCNGFKKQVNVTDLNAAKKIAYDLMSYTQFDVIIKNEKHEELCVSRWYGVLPDDDDDYLIKIGSGFYDNWEVL